MEGPSPMARRIMGLVFFLVLAGFSFALTEAAYRVYLRHTLYEGIKAKAAPDARLVSVFMSIPHLGGLIESWASPSMKAIG